jgi:hypothetical protein
LNLLHGIWIDLTQAQAILLSGMLTVLAAVLAVFLGGKVFQSRVASLEEAIKKTEKIIEDHLTRVADKVASIEEITNATARNVVSNRGEDEEAGEDIQVDASIHQFPENAEGPEIDLRTRFLEAWNSIRGALEDRASDTEIDGRTRAKYLRIDRRNYQRLVDALKNDGNLNDAKLFSDAISLRQAYKNNRREIVQESVEKMEQFQNKLNV